MKVCVSGFVHKLRNMKKLIFDPEFKPFIANKKSRLFPFRNFWTNPGKNLSFNVFVQHKISTYTF